MSERQTIIDVTPVNHSREQAANNSQNTSQQRTYQQPTWSTPSGYGSATSTGPTPPYGTWYSQGSADAAASKNGSSILGGFAQIAAGTGLVMIGIPMLILPGPGLLCIAGGFALALSGTRKLLG